MEHSQEQLFVLATQANKLGLGSVFNNYFFDSKVMTQAQVPTVQQIFDANPKFKSKYFFLICLKVGMPWEWKKMSSRSRSFIRFANFLLEKGFDENFWPPLEYIKKATLV
ncbi:MAG: hypothetical protein KBD52_02145 [Candidatus Pacebacteria bacterium]|nr:hypothetical protein [Candidatus Paceibacterota bacterium]